MISISDWKPIGVESFEPNADRAIKDNDNNTLIIAGPGAGKTELLAQKACYLLQTNQCSYPKRILAISFKRDAKTNLKERVELRTSKQLASRFDSMTFDSFAKSILDRFCNGLPEEWKPSVDYEIDSNIQKAHVLKELLMKMIGKDGLSRYDIDTINRWRFEKEYFTKYPLVDYPFTEYSVCKITSYNLWKYLLKEVYPSKLSFPMISRLAELIILKNPLIRKAILNTYSHIFLDEFQDTTNIQYELTKACFLGSDCKFTAVGDGKQKIMDWAGALTGIFEYFQKDFNSKTYRLIRNYRSAPNLVNIQYVIMKNLEGETVEKPQSMDESHDAGECRLYTYENCEFETKHLVLIISEIVKQQKVSLRDICILSRNFPNKYTYKLKKELYKDGINSRVETDFQDILSEPVTKLIFSMLRLIVNKRSPNDWTFIYDFYYAKDGLDENSRSDLIDVKIQHFIHNERSKFEIDTIDDLINLNSRIINALDLNYLRNSFPQYLQGDLLDETIEKLNNKLFHYLQNYKDMNKALDEFEGYNSIPIMTMHKSKGLEFHTVIFMGLEDSALWGFRNNPQSETCGFFVAFSRAKKRVIFTACNNREIDGVVQRQTIEEIAPIYELFNAAGVKREHIISH